jgi:kynurenine--oxoglutarate transaminase/cysteine-S-conjugate beta-lyase/glutamine--phenylpyruvate transaminase
MPLAEILAHDYSIQLGVDLNPATQVATAVGCTNALYCALQGLLSKGDEVILLEPAFDIVSHFIRTCTVIHFATVLACPTVRRSSFIVDL